MPAASLGSVGTGTNTTSGTTLAVTASTNIAAGTVLLIALTFDNHASTTAPTLSLSASGGGTWTQCATTYGAGVTTTAGSGIWGAVFVTTTTSAISSGATITTVTFGSAVVKKIAQVVGYTGVTTTTRVSWSVGALSGVSNSAGTLVAGDLVIGVICSENNATPGADADTLNGSWSTLAGFATTGGSANTNVAVGVQSKAITATGTQTYNGTSANDIVTFVGVLTPSAAIIQSAYRFYADGTETGSAALAAENTAYAWNSGTGDLNLGLRVKMQAYTSFSVGAATDDYVLQYEENASGTWIPISAGSKVVAFNSTNLTEGAATTARLTAGTGSFVAGKVAEDGLVDDLQVTASNYTELLYSITLKSAVATTGTLRFRVLHNDSLTYSGSTVTPTITVTAPNPKVGTLVDDFATTVDKVTKWASSSAAVAWDASGRAMLPLSNTYPVLQTINTGSYDLTGSAIFIRAYPTLGGNGTREFFMEVLRGGVTNDKLSMFASGTDFNARKVVAGAITNGPGATYHATNHAWWKISESGGTIYFWTSTDGAIWTQFWSTTVTWDITNVYVNISAGWYTSDPGGATAYVDNVNIPGVAAKMSTFTDTFDTQVDPLKWESWGGTAWDAGRLRAEASANPGYGGAFTDATYDFTESSVFAKVTVPSMVGTTARECLMQVYIDDDNMVAAFTDSGGGLVFRIRQAGVNDNQYGLVYNPILHAYWRLRMSGTTVYLDTSPDGSTWTNQKSGTTSLTLTAAKLYLITGQWAAEAAIVPAYFDDVNTPGAITGYPKIETLSDSFDTEVNKSLVWQSANPATVWDAGRAKIPCTTAYPNLGTNIIGSYNLTGSSVYARVVPPPDGTGTRQTMMETVLGGDSSTRLRMGFWAGSMRFYRTIAGVDTEGTAIPYDPIAHAWWRIRESGGTAYFDTSPDSQTWTNRWSIAPGFAITQVALNFLSGYYGTETASDAFVDYVNTPKGAPTWVGVGGTYSSAGATLAVPLPSGWQPGDLAIMVVGGDAGTDPNYPTPSGWTFRGKTAATNMFSYVFSRVLQSGDGSAGYTVSGSTSLAVGVWRDAALGTIGTFGIRSGTSFTASAPDIAPLGYRAHIWSDRSVAASAGEADALPTALTYGTARGFYGGNPTLSAAVGIDAVFFGDSVPGQSGANTATLIDSSTNAWGLQLDLGGPYQVAGGGRPKVYLAGSFQKKPLKVWSGSAWVEKPVKVWDGTQWKKVT